MKYLKIKFWICFILTDVLYNMLNRAFTTLSFRFIHFINNFDCCIVKFHIVQPVALSRRTIGRGFCWMVNNIGSEYIYTMGLASWCRESCVNLLRPSGAYMCLWTESSLAQIMTCCLFSTKPLPDTRMTFFQWHPQRTSILIQEKASENFGCKMWAILSWPQYVKVLQ